MQKQPQTRPSLVFAGMQVGLTSLTNLDFDPSKPYTGCKICGALFQSNADRYPVGVFFAQKDDFNHDYRNVHLFALGMRKEWSVKHSKLHSQKEHDMLRISGRWATPEAAERLASMGVFSATDLVLDDEVQSALNAAPKVPNKDSEDHVRRNHF